MEVSLLSRSYPQAMKPILQLVAALLLSSTTVAQQPDLDSLLTMSAQVQKVMASVPGCVEITPSVVPVPAAAWLFLSGVGVLAGIRRRA